MPIAHDPSSLEFYVYAFHVRGVPFYVGEGRSTRASDRVRFVRYLMNREASGRPVKWVFSNRVLREFLLRGATVDLAYLASALTRDAALEQEQQEIRRFLGAGFCLANRMYNADSGQNVSRIVDFV